MGMFSSGQWATLQQRFAAFDVVQRILVTYLRASDGIQNHETLVADGSETSFTLAKAPLGTPLVLITSGGAVSVWRDPADYTRAGKVLTFPALPAGTIMDVNYVALPT